MASKQSPHMGLSLCCSLTSPMAEAWGSELEVNGSGWGLRPTQTRPEQASGGSVRSRSLSLKSRGKQDHQSWPCGQMCAFREQGSKICSRSLLGAGENPLARALQETLVWGSQTTKSEMDVIVNLTSKSQKPRPGFQPWGPERMWPSEQLMGCRPRPRRPARSGLGCLWVRVSWGELAIREHGAWAGRVDCHEHILLAS